MDEIQIFREFIREKGLRNTPEREAIVREIFSTHDHFDADELLLRLRNKNKNVSKASIYRTIPLLVESGLIKEVFYEDGHLHYEHIYGHKDHCHFRCICCGKILEFAEDEILKIQSRIEKKLGFVVTSHRFELSGYCPECAQEQGMQKACTPSDKGRGRNKEKGVKISGNGLSGGP